MYMFTEEITPRFTETDALGHINNTVIPVWFEQARRPVFQLFTPDLDIRQWKLIIARIEVDFIAETLYGHPVTVHTFPVHIGNTSLQLRQEVYQRARLCARGLAVLVHYDYRQKSKVSIPQTIRRELEKHLQPDSTAFRPAP